jgi:hypothetical protein
MFCGFGPCSEYLHVFFRVWLWGYAVLNLNPLLPMPFSTLNDRSKFLVDKRILLKDYITSYKGTRNGLKGKTVKGRRGPAAVSGDEIHKATVHGKWMGRCGE